MSNLLRSPSLAESVQAEALDWDGAVCAQIDPEVFYPELGASSRPAKAACAGCPLIEACLEYALRNDERYGVWGGLSTYERRKLLRTQPTGGETDLLLSIDRDAPEQDGQGRDSDQA